MKLRVRFLLALALSLAIAAAGAGLVIETGAENTTPPSPDPGWDHVGFRSAYNAVYLGVGWVLTANHVGAGDTSFNGVSYPWSPGTDLRLSNPDATLADLVLFRLAPPYPPLSPLSISAVRPALGTPVFLIARGSKRGDPFTWNPPGPQSYDGYLWDFAGYMRWGTNFVESLPSPAVLESSFGTHLIGTEFDQFGGGHSAQETQAADGDSGGAVFAVNGASYDLAGILIGIVSTYSNQPSGTALYGNFTVAADLSIYRDEIVETMPEPNGGLLAGAGLLAVLTRGSRRAPNAGTRRACRDTGYAASSPRRA